jgi:hypothetical protein
MAQRSSHQGTMVQKLSLSRDTTNQEHLNYITLQLGREHPPPAC